jgi:hypothetical protein
MRNIGGVLVASLVLSGCALYSGGGDDDDDHGGTITVTAYNTSGIPLAEHSVLFLDLDDVVVDEATLDASGIAQGSAPDGGSVVVIVDDSATMPELAMRQNVHAGDAFVWGMPAVGLGECRTVAVTFPDLDGAVAYVAKTSGGEARSATTSVDAVFCGDDDDVAVVARDASDLPLGTLFAQDVDASGNVTLTGPYAPNEAVAIEFGASSAGLIVDFTTLTVVGSVGVIDRYNTELIAPASNEVMMLEAPVAHTQGSTLQTVIMATDGASAPQVNVTHYTQSRLGGIYFGGSNAPELSALAYDAATATASWAAGQASRPASGTVVRLVLEGASRTAHWNVALASDATTVTLPALPPAYDGFTPQPDDRWTIGLVEYINDEPIMLSKAHASAFQIDQLPSPLELMIDYTFASASSP